MMKKNRMMRLASGLLVAVLATTSMISGTYAKYVTTDSASDTARVARWGVTALVSGSLFGEHYNGNTETADGDKVTTGIKGSVDVDTADTADTNIVAPGTKSDKGLLIAVSGKPEVKTQVAISIDTTGENKAYEDIWLASGDYGLMIDVSESTTMDNVIGLYTVDNNTYTIVKNNTDYYANTKYFELVNPGKTDVTQITDGRVIGDKYYPIVWTVDGNPYVRVSDLANALTKNKKFNATYEAGTELSGTNGAGYLNITWAWPFESNFNGVPNTKADEADTILGNLIAYTDKSNYQVVQISEENITGITVADGVAKAGTTQVANLKIAFNTTVTVTQVD